MSSQHGATNEKKKRGRPALTNRRGKPTQPMRATRRPSVRQAVVQIIDNRRDNREEQMDTDTIQLESTGNFTEIINSVDNESALGIQERSENQSVINKLLRENEELKRKIQNDEMDDFLSKRMRKDTEARVDLRKYNNKMAKFDGTEEYELWWTEAQGYLNQFDNIPEQERVKILTASITGSARLILNAGGYFNDTQELNTYMAEAFRTTDDWWSKLLDAMQKPDETIHTFMLRIRVLVIRAFSESKTPMTREAMDNYMKRILMKNTLPEIKNKLAISQPVTLANALACASAYELENKVENGAKSDEKLDFKNQLKQIHAKLAMITKDPKGDKTSNESTGGTPLDSTFKLEETLNNFMAIITNGQATGGRQRDGADSNNRYGRGPILFNCLHCGLKGHGYARCFKATDEDKKKIRDQQQIKYKALNSQVAGKPSQ